MKEVLLLLAILPVVALGQRFGNVGMTRGLGTGMGFPFGYEGFDAPDMIMTPRGMQPVYGDIVHTPGGPLQVMDHSDMIAMQMLQRSMQGGLTGSGLTNTGLTSGLTGGLPSSGLTSGLTNSIGGGLGGLGGGSMGNSLFSLLNSPVPSRGARRRAKKRRLA